MPKKENPPNKPLVEEICLGYVTDDLRKTDEPAITQEGRKYILLPKFAVSYNIRSDQIKKRVFYDLKAYDAERFTRLEERLAQLEREEVEHTKTQELRKDDFGIRLDEITTWYRDKKNGLMIIIPESRIYADKTTYFKSVDDSSLRLYSLEDGIRRIKLDKKSSRLDSVSITLYIGGGLCCITVPILLARICGGLGVAIGLKMMIRDSRKLMRELRSLPSYVGKEAIDRLCKIYAPSQP